jgi:hypothetical protein
VLALSSLFPGLCHLLSDTDICVAQKKGVEPIIYFGSTPLFVDLKW